MCLSSPCSRYLTDQPFLIKQVMQSNQKTFSYIVSKTFSCYLRYSAVMPRLRLTFVLVFVTIHALASSTVAKVHHTKGAEIFILGTSLSGNPQLEDIGSLKLFRETPHTRHKRVPAPPAPLKPTPLPVFPPLPSPSGPCNIPIVKLAAIKRKCSRKFLRTPWVEVSLFTTCFTRTYFIRWKFCYTKRICDRRVARFRKCVFPGMIRCQGTEDLTCPTFVVLRCAKKQPTELIKPKIH